MLVHVWTKRRFCKYTANKSYFLAVYPASTAPCWGRNCCVEEPRSSYVPRMSLCPARLRSNCNITVTQLLLRSVYIPRMVYSCTWTSPRTCTTKFQKYIFTRAHDGLGVRRPRRHKPLRHKDQGFKIRLKAQASFSQGDIWPRRVGVWGSVGPAFSSLGIDTKINIGIRPGT